MQWVNAPEYGLSGTDSRRSAALAEIEKIVSLSQQNVTQPGNRQCALVQGAVVEVGEREVLASGTWNPETAKVGFQVRRCTVMLTRIGPRQGPIIGDKGAAGRGLLLKSTTVLDLNLNWLIWRRELLSMSDLLGGLDRGRMELPRTAFSRIQPPSLLAWT